MDPETRSRIITRATNIPGMFWPVEMAVLQDIFAGSQTHVEIGSFCGRSLYATASAMQPGSKIIAIDTFATPMTVSIVPSQEWWQTVFNATAKAIRESFGVEVQTLKVLSSEAARTFATESVDSVFIDGNHNKQFVAMDIEFWWPILKPGGIMAGHDFSPRFPGVEDAVHERFGSEFRVHSNTRIWSIVKE